jgi:alpha-keto-acid decarboxylase
LEMGAALDALTGILAGRGISSPAVVSNSDAAPADRPGRDQPLNQKVLWDRFCDALTPGNIVLADQGTSFYGMATHRLPQGVTFIGQPLWGSIGYTLPATLGAGLAQRDRRPVLLIGDGAAQLTVQELGAFSREGLSPVVVVVNNDGYTIERMIHGKTAPYNDIVRWNWADIPTALGVTNHLAFRAETYGELDDAFVAAAEHQDRMVLIEAVVPRLDIPDLLTELVAPTSADGSPRR